MNKKVFLLIGAGVLVVLGVVVLVVFQPQRLFFDDVVDEARPESISVPVDDMMKPRDPFAPNTTATTQPTTSESGSNSNAASETTTTQAPAPQVLKGDFVSLDHPTSGFAEVIPVSQTDRILRLDDFRTDNGPDLFVYLTKVPADGSQPFDVEFVDLGRLKGNVGGQNYEIPADVDLSEFSTVVIWCKRFSSAFGAAEMTPR